MESESVLAFLRELEQADEEVGAVLAELDELARESEAVRLRALELEAWLLRVPADLEAAGKAVTRAREELVAAREARAEADEALERAGEDAVRAAEHFAVRASDRVSVAERRAAKADGARAALEEEAREAVEESGALERRAHELARALRGRPRLAEDAGADPAPGLAGVAEWGSTARAALFVARGQLAAERDAVIRQANELGSLALGEPLTSASAAVVARQVERHLRD
ncbi:MAG: hypothetical protein ABI649_06080 [Gaiellaceae bacterium]